MFLTAVAFRFRSPRVLPMLEPSIRQETRHRGLTLIVAATAHDAALTAARIIQGIVNEADRRHVKATLGLATGKTPQAIYAELVRAHRDERISFRHVVTYNLDEYYPISPRDPLSYRTYMHRHLFAQVDLPPESAHVLDGSVPPAFADEACQFFDRWIDADGGLDLQLLGIGRNGHIGFNEPEPHRSVAEFAALPSRKVTLDVVTRADAAADFGGNLDAVPRYALTVGPRVILAARRIVMVALGSSKARIVARALTEDPTTEVPASLLQLPEVAPRVTWILDPDAASLLPDLT